MYIEMYGGMVEATREAIESQPAASLRSIQQCGHPPFCLIANEVPLIDMCL